MKQRGVIGLLAMCIALTMLSSCGGNRSAASDPDAYLNREDVGNTIENDQITGDKGSTIWDLFARSDADVSVRVNKYLWNASLEVLDFLPIQSVDPFSGVIITGYGVPPGGGRSYRATVYIRDPALDARSLHVAMQTRNGAAVSKATLKAVEDAILTRARQMRVADSRF